MDGKAASREYEPPKLRELGSFHDLTQAGQKNHGKPDGFAFGAHLPHLSNLSP
jgi:hypothetical protein